MAKAATKHCGWEELMYMPAFIITVSTMCALGYINVWNFFHLHCFVTSLINLLKPSGNFAYRQVLTFNNSP
jgi:hypothetical protein